MKKKMGYGAKMAAIFAVGTVLGAVIVSVKKKGERDCLNCLCADSCPYDPVDMDHLSNKYGAADDNAGPGIHLDSDAFVSHTEIVNFANHNIG